MLMVQGPLVPKRDRLVLTQIHGEFGYRRRAVGLTHLVIFLNQNNEAARILASGVEPLHRRSGVAGVMIGVQHNAKEAAILRARVPVVLECVVRFVR